MKLRQAPNPIRKNLKIIFVRNNSCGLFESSDYLYGIIIDCGTKTSLKSFDKDIPPSKSTSLLSILNQIRVSPSR